VPVSFPGGALTSHTWPLAKDDPLLLMPLDADFGAYFASGSVNQLPQSKRRFALSDCVALPLAPRSQADKLPATALAADGAVLAGLHYIGSSAAALFAALDTDQVPKNSPMSTWMGQVEVFINGLVLGTVTPLSTAFASIGNVQATATKLKAE